MRKRKVVDAPHMRWTQHTCTLGANAAQHVQVHACLGWSDVRRGDAPMNVREGSDSDEESDESESMGEDEEFVTCAGLWPVSDRSGVCVARATHPQARS
jgi:hypothetical protein